VQPELDPDAGRPALRRWDPRWKLATLFLVILAVALDRPGARAQPSLARDLPPAAAGLALAAALVALARIPPGVVLRRLRAPAVFLVLVGAAFPLTYGGERLRLGFISLSKDGLVAALLLAAGAFAIILIALAAFAGLTGAQAGDALRRLGVPAPLVHAGLLATRYAGIHARRWRRLRLALRARAFRPRADLRTCRVGGHAVGVLLAGSIEHAARLQGAMKCRGYSGSLAAPGATRAGARDLGLAAAGAVAAAALVLWKFA
jgi:cobalt/nickel transport system permease protein